MLTSLCVIMVGAGNFFTTPVIFPEPLAYSRTPESGFEITMANHEMFNTEVQYFKAKIGHTLPLVTVTLNKDNQLQLAAQAGAWQTLGYREGAFPLLTEDFLMSMPLYYRYRNLYLGLKYSHISGHLGDGADKLMRTTLSRQQKKDLEQKEHLADELGVGIQLIKPIVYSRDFASSHIAYKYARGDLGLVLYKHGGYITKTRPLGIGRWFFGGGAEIRYTARGADYLYANDLTYTEDTDTLNFSNQLGIEINRTSEELFKVRFILSGYIGSDPRGQMLDKKLKELSFGIAIRSH